MKRRISMKELENKVALVSSSTRGIGLALSLYTHLTLPTKRIV